MFKLTDTYLIDFDYFKKCLSSKTPNNCETSTFYTQKKSIATSIYVKIRRSFKNVSKHIFTQYFNMVKPKLIFLEIEIAFKFNFFCGWHSRFFAVPF